MPVVTALRATKHGRIGLHVDGRFVCVVSEALIARHHLFQGKDLDDAELDAVREEAVGAKAMADAHRLLAHRSRSRQELQRRLADKGHDAQTITRAMADLEAQGFVDDAAFAAAFVSDKRRLGGWGDQRLSRARFSGCFRRADRGRPRTARRRAGCATGAGVVAAAGPGPSRERRCRPAASVPSVAPARLRHRRRLSSVTLVVARRGHSREAVSMPPEG